MSKEKPTRNELIWSLRDLQDEDITSTHKLMLYVILSCINDKYEVARGSEGLSNISCLHERTARKVISDLRDMEYILLTKKGGLGRKDPNNYILNTKKIIQKTSFSKWEFRSNNDQNKEGLKPTIRSNNGHLSRVLNTVKEGFKPTEALRAEALPKAASSSVLGEQEKRRIAEREYEEKVAKEWDTMTKEQKQEVFKKRMSL